MSFVDRYWEWRRRRALKASLRTPERTRELALVAEVLMESRGFSRRSGDREQALPVDEAAAAPVRPDDAPSKRPEKAETHKTALFPTATLPVGR